MTTDKPTHDDVKRALAQGRETIRRYREMQKAMEAIRDLHRILPVVEKPDWLIAINEAGQRYKDFQQQLDQAVKPYRDLAKSIDRAVEPLRTGYLDGKPWILALLDSSNQANSRFAGAGNDALEVVGRIGADSKDNELLMLLGTTAEEIADADKELAELVATSGDEEPPVERVSGLFQKYKDAEVGVDGILALIPGGDDLLD